MRERFFRWGKPVALLLGAFAVLLPLLRADPPKPFRISGVLISSRDGGPVPYCRITATFVRTDTATTPRVQNSEGPDGNRGGGRAGGSGPDGRPNAPANTPLEATADASGKFSLELQRAGKYRLVATARGFRAQAFELHDGLSSAIVLTDAAPTYHATFRIAPDSLISGLVLDDAGEPVANAQVSAELVPVVDPATSKTATRPRALVFGTTDDRGRYELSPLSPGTYHIKVNQATPWYAIGARNGFRTQPNATNPQTSPDPSLEFIFPATYFPGTEEEQGAELIRLAAGEDRQADFHLSAVPAVHLVIPRQEVASMQSSPLQDGRLEQTAAERMPNRGQQSRPATITRVSGDTGNSYSSLSSTVGRDGTTQWDFGGLSPGTYEVNVPRPGTPGAFDVRRVEIRSGSPAVVTLESATSLTTVQVIIDGAPDSDVSSVEFVDTETGHRVASAPASRGRRGFRGDDSPPEDLAPAEAPPVKARTIALSPHRYEVYVSGNSGVFLTGITATGATVAGRAVDIADGSPALTLHVATGRAELSGVAALDGKPALAALVLLVPASLGESGNLRTIERDQTSTDGSFILRNIIPGRYILVAVERGWATDWRKQEILAGFLAHGIPVELKASDKLRQELQALAP